MRRIILAIHYLMTLTLSLALCCMLASSMTFAATNPATARFDIVNQPDSVLPLDDSLKIAVVAHGLPITLKSAVFAVTDDSTGKDLSSAFSLPMNCNCTIKTEETSIISFLVEKKVTAQTASAKGGLILMYKAGDSTDMIASARWGFAMVRRLASVGKIAATPRATA